MAARTTNETTGIDDSNGGADAGAELPTDGRSARAVRTRAAIVDALLDLLNEGDLQPTANRIAERAGISLRLIYHHFGDLESLFRAASARESDRIAAMVEPIEADLPLDDRIEAIVAQRAFVLEWVTPVRQASLLYEPFSEELRSARDAIIARAWEHVRDVFARELACWDDDTRPTVAAGLSAALGWGIWNDLRTAGRSVEEARGAVELLVRNLLAARP